MIDHVATSEVSNSYTVINSSIDERGLANVFEENSGSILEIDEETSFMFDKVSYYNHSSIDNHSIVTDKQVKLNECGSANVFEENSGSILEIDEETRLMPDKVSYYNHSSVNNHSIVTDKQVELKNVIAERISEIELNNDTYTHCEVDRVYTDKSSMDKMGNDDLTTVIIASKTNNNCCSSDIVTYDPSTSLLNDRMKLYSLYKSEDDETSDDEITIDNASINAILDRYSWITLSTAAINMLNVLMNDEEIRKHVWNIFPIDEPAVNNLLNVDLNYITSLYRTTSRSVTESSSIICTNDGKAKRGFTLNKIIKDIPNINKIISKYSLYTIVQFLKSLISFSSDVNSVTATLGVELETEASFEINKNIRCYSPREDVRYVGNNTIMLESQTHERIYVEINIWHNLDRSH